MILRLLAKAIGVLNQNHVFFVYKRILFGCNGRRTCIYKVPRIVFIDIQIYKIIFYTLNKRRSVNCNDWQRNDYIVTYYIPYYKDTVYKDQWIQRTFQLLFLSILAQIYSISE